MSVEGHAPPSLAPPAAPARACNDCSAHARERGAAAPPLPSWPCACPWGHTHHRINGRCVLCKAGPVGKAATTAVAAPAGG